MRHIKVNPSIPPSPSFVELSDPDREEVDLTNEDFFTSELPSWMQDNHSSTLPTQKIQDDNGQRLIEAIPTRYNNYLFRSRTEARWAVFWDALGIQWEYEVEGYKVRATKDDYYLPDFWFPDYEWFAEIKPIQPTSGTLTKLSAFSDLIRYRGAKGLLILVGQPGRIQKTIEIVKRELNINDDVAILAATEAALSARFEHGESPDDEAKKAIALLSQIMKETGGTLVIDKGKWWIDG